MISICANDIQIIVFATDTNAFLRVDGIFAWRLSVAQKHIFELEVAKIDE